MASFFEKLTGSISIDKTEEPPVEIETTAEESIPENEETEILAETASAKSEASVLSRHISHHKEKNVWSQPQAEGQLTVDIYEKGDKIIIQSAIAGTAPDDIDITMTRDMITIKGTRKQMEEVRNENYFFRELYWGAFSRSIILPEEIDESKAEAFIKNGILTIKLPKKQANGQKLKVKTE